MQLKKSFMKGCQIFAAHMEEAARDKVASIEDHPVLKYFDMFFRKFKDYHRIDTLISLLIWCKDLPWCPRILIEWACQN
jgi:hypothetical protein